MLVHALCHSDLTRRTVGRASSTTTWVRAERHDAHQGQYVLMLISDRDIRVLTTDGKHIAEHRIDPDRIYQPRR